MVEVTTIISLGILGYITLACLLIITILLLINCIGKLFVCFKKETK